MRGFKRMTAAAATAAVAAFVAAGCGDSEGAGSSGTEASSGSTEITVAAFKGADSAPLYVGVEHGIFERAGLDVTVSPVSTGADAVALLQSNQAQFGVTQPAVIIQAIGRGVPLRLVTGMSVYSGDSDYVSFLTKDPEVRSLRDLAGKRVGIIVFKNVVDLGLQLRLRELGVDPASVDVVPMPPPQQLMALKNGSVDVIAPAEPSQSVALQDPEVRSLGAVWQAVTGGKPGVAVPGAALMATSSYLDGNGDIARRFSAAMAEAADYAEAHPDQSKAAIAKYLGLGENLVAETTLPTFTSELQRSDVVLQARHEEELGWVEEAPTADEIFWEAAGT